MPEILISNFNEIFMLMSSISVNLTSRIVFMSSGLILQILSWARK